ncbi:ATP-binding cassette sub-family A member 3-like [Contarinia nasturtii]|uniref:ATP-binding cassette sub-family A member 3-like n=1 Tax=Contarinia nasturtii TaxID=265458 RepID=UPI0012D3A66E|nr:ATP-binding cassette sub-family A member 3-like [Contarinia nasturtii]
MGEKSTEIPQIQINTFILKHFPGAYLKEKYQGILTYYLPQTSELKWSLMFDHMETIKEILGIEDYSICQTTLEQVFLSFTKPYCDEQCRYDYKTNALRLNVSNV